MPLSIALRQNTELLSPPCLFLEGAGSLDVQSPEDFVPKFRRFLDNLNHLKYLHHIQFVEDSHLSLSDHTRFQKYKGLAQHVVRDLWQALGHPEDSLLGLKNFFENIPLILSLPDVSHVQIQKPFHAVVIAAGPSLELEWEWLKQIQQSCLLLCVDVCLKPLLAHGITPHFVVATERDDYSVPFFHDLPSSLKTILIGQPTIQRSIFENYPGQKMTVLKYSGPFLWLPLKRAQFWAASSSAHLCYRLVCMWGAQSVALVGQDLSYHPETFQSHAHNPVYPEWSSSQEIENCIQKNHATWVPGNTREQVLTNPIWSHFARDYQMLVEETQVPTTNTSTFGMKISGIPWEPLQKWIQERASAQFQFNVPEKNPMWEKECHAVQAKWRDALDKLESLLHQLNSPEAAKDPNALCASLLQYPHFLELVLEVVFLPWVQVENICFNAPEWRARETKTKFLKLVAVYLEKILGLMKRVEHEMGLWVQC